MLTKSLTIAFLATSAILFAPVPATEAAQISAAEDGKRKINISGRQRMLSQRMAKAVCFAAIDIDTAGHTAMAVTAHQEFAKALAGLRNGDTDLGILPENAPAILDELSLVEQLWGDYGDMVGSVSDGTVISGAALAQVSAMSGPILVQMNKAVGEFEKRYGASDIHPALALAINMSGRQRMLSQKSSKEFCMVLANIMADENRAALSATVDLFETSLVALMDGDDEIGLPEAPTDEIYEQLELVQSLWDPVAEVFKALANGGTPTEDQIAFVAEQNNIILVEMNRAVGMYAGL